MSRLAPTAVRPVNTTQMLSLLSICSYCGQREAIRVTCGDPDCQRLRLNERMRGYQRQRDAETPRRKRFLYPVSNYVCRNCDGLFAAEQEQSYCSTSCANKARRWTLICQACSSEFEAPASRAKTCEACRPEVRKAAQIRRREIIREREAPERAIRAAQMAADRAEQAAQRAAERASRAAVSEADRLARWLVTRPAERRRRAQKAAREAVRREALAEVQGWLCSWCKMPLGGYLPPEVQKDHIIPKILLRIEADWNFQLLHRECNETEKRGQMTPEAWRLAADHGILAEVRARAKVPEPDLS
jgi:hypothetical protein